MDQRATPRQSCNLSLPADLVRQARRDTLNLRTKPEDRGLIDRAAALTGKTKTEFVLQAARRAAEDALLDQTLFLAGAEAFEAFQARLDEPPRPNERLRRSLQTPAPWE
nr:DUF1778 domain-containing protein [uncultured Rhodopila sp.]